MIALIDNYDSFVHNLACFVGKLGFEPEVFRNDKVTVDELEALNPDKIIISPGPSTPKNAGISLSVIEKLGHRIPILGVCLGHQAIGEVFGGQTTRAIHPMHGKSSLIHHTGRGIFQHIDNPMRVGRYHSLISDGSLCPKTLIINALSEDNEIMSYEHCSYPIYGVQFHPESILTHQGEKLIENFLKIPWKPNNS